MDIGRPEKEIDIQPVTEPVPEREPVKAPEKVEAPGDPVEV